MTRLEVGEQADLPTETYQRWSRSTSRHSARAAALRPPRLIVSDPKDIGIYPGMSEALTQPVPPELAQLPWKFLFDPRQQIT